MKIILMVHDCIPKNAIIGIETNKLTCPSRIIIRERMHAKITFTIPVLVNIFNLLLRKM